MYNIQVDSPYLDKPDPNSSLSIIINWMKSFPRRTKVLDIGTATGFLGQRCGKFGFNLRGLEPIQQWADKAIPYYDELLCATIEDAPDEFLSDQDVVICADVLEHTRNPQEVLNRLVRLQNPQTQFLISVPNVANIWVRLNLLFGKFDYTEKGILDQTHLRFFTKRSFLELLHGAGLVVEEMRYTPIPLDQVNSFFKVGRPGYFISKLLALFTPLFPGLWAYQFVARSVVHNKGNTSR